MPSRRFRFPMDLQMFADETSPPRGSGFSLEYVQDLRQEAASWRTKFREAEEQVTKLKTDLEGSQKKVTEQETKHTVFLEKVRSLLKLDASVKEEDLPTKIQEATSKSTVSIEKAQDALKKAAFIASAVRKGISKEALEDAFKLADFSSVKVDLEKSSVFPVDKDGKQLQKDGKPIDHLDDLVDGMLKAKPYLAGRTPSIGGPSSPPSGGGKEEEGSGIGALLAKERLEQQKLHKEKSVDYFPK